MKATFFILLFFFFLSGNAKMGAREKGVLVVQVTDLQNKPIKGIVLALKGGGSPGTPTDDVGRTRINLGDYIGASSRVTLMVISSLKGNMVMISPWDGEVIVPSFENSPNNFVSVYLSPPGDKALLQNGQALASITNKILNSIQQRQKKKFDLQGVQSSTIDPEEIKRSALEEVARKYGLPSEDIDKAIRAWGENSQDSYHKGLAALYEKKYPEAAKQLVIAYDKRKDDLYDVVYNLADAYYGEKKYELAAEKYIEASALKPDDMMPLHFLADSYSDAGKIHEALEVRKKIKERMEHAPEKVTPTTYLIYLVNLTFIGRAYLDLSLLDSALIYQKKALILSDVLKNSKDSTVQEGYTRIRAFTINDIGISYFRQGDYNTYFENKLQAISILENFYGPDNSVVEPLYQDYGKYTLFLSRYPGKADTAARYINHSIKLLGKDAAINSYKLVDAYLLLSFAEVLNRRIPEVLKALYDAEKVGNTYWEPADKYFKKIYDQLGFIYSHRDTDSAIKYYKKAAEICLANNDTGNYNNYLGQYWEQKGTKYYNAKNYQTAILNYDSAYAAGKDISYLHSSAICHGYLKEYQIAIEYYKRVLVLDTGNKETYIHNDLGTAYAANGQWGEAYKQFKIFEDQHADTGRSYKNWAMYYGHKKDKEKTIECLQNAVRFGYNDMEWITKDESLEFIRDDERYKKLVLNKTNK